MRRFRPLTLFRVCGLLLTVSIADAQQTRERIGDSTTYLSGV